MKPLVLPLLKVVFEYAHSDKVSIINSLMKKIVSVSKPNKPQNEQLYVTISSV